MSKHLKLTVEKRELSGKGPNRRLRDEGLVPGVFYNGKGENFMVQCQYTPLEKAYEKLGSNQVFDLEVKGEKGVIPALIWKIERNPVKGFLRHVDFYGVDMSHAMRLSVPLEVVGEPIGVKQEGGLLEIFRDSIEVECMPNDIPESITIDVSELHVGDNIHVEDLKVPSTVKLVYEEHFSVAGVVAKAAEEDLEGGAQEAEVEAEAPEEE